MLMAAPISAFIVRSERFTGCRVQMVRSDSQWGLNGVTPVMGNYDGDGATDFTVFRASTSTFTFCEVLTESRFFNGGDLPATNHSRGL
jgi:hypothetical protein